MLIFVAAAGKQTMENIESAGRTIRETLNYPLIGLGEATITLWVLLYFLIGIFLLFYLTARLKNLLVKHILIRYTSEIGVRQAIGGIVRYVLIFLGLLIILQTAGIDLSALTVLAGALGIGIGFGLQHITNDNVSIIVPNSELLLEAGREDSHVLKDPPLTIRLKEFGDNGIHFELLVWTTSYMHRRGKFFSDINIGIIKKFNQHGIQIPFPQRDVYIKKGDISIHHDAVGQTTEKTKP